MIEDPNIILEGSDQAKREQEQYDLAFAALVEMGYSEENIEPVLKQGMLDIPQAIETIERFKANQAQIVSGTLYCMICQSALTHINSIAIPDCMDSYCRDCLHQYLKLRIEESQVLTMPCPNHECSVEIRETLIKSLVSEALYNKYMLFKANEELCKNPYLRWCPQPDCKGYGLGSDKKLELKCNVCEYLYCFYCAEAWHPDVKCKAASERQADRWAKSHGAKYCPNCKRRVEKNQGCDHMTCVKCRYQWCWLCGEKYFNGHVQQCEVKKFQKKNPPIEFVLKCLFCPFLIPFLCIICCITLVQKAKSPRLTQIGWKIAAYIVGVLIGILLSPIFFATAPFFFTITFWYDCIKCSCCSSTCRVFSSIFFGFLTAPLFMGFFLIGAIIAHFLGLILLFWKLFIVVWRLKDPHFMRPKSNYGY